MIPYYKIRIIASYLEECSDGSIEWERAFESSLLENGWTLEEYYSARARFLTILPDRE